MKTALFAVMMTATFTPSTTNAIAITNTDGSCNFDCEIWSAASKRNGDHDQCIKDTKHMGAQAV